MASIHTTTQQGLRKKSPPPVRHRKVKSYDHDASLKMINTTLTLLLEGDFSARIPYQYLEDGLVGEIATKLNKTIDRLDKMSKEFVRVSAVVANEGRLSERAVVEGAVGAWANKLNSLNSVIGELARPTKEIARVMRAVAAGDLSQKVTVEAKGEILEAKTTINTMVKTLQSFTSEVTRVAKEVGTEGRLGGQAEVKGVEGTWKDLTDNVNMLAGNLTNQVRNIAAVTTAVANGDLSKKITVEAKGEILELKNTINTMVDQLNSFAAEVTRVAKEVGTQGQLGGQADVKGVSGTWRDLTENVNQLAGNLTNQVRNIALVATAVAKGDLSQKITVEASGEVLELKDTLNKMVDQLNSFAAEVTRMAKEVGTEGRLGGQAEVKGVEGTWKDLTDNVNMLAGNLTNQVRNIAAVTTAVANGDLSKKITVEAKGEILELKNTINIMVDQLNSFAAEVTRVAREVGVEGRLGGQAQVPGVGGTWRELTDNVNQLAGNLTNQVRNIALVTTAVANGDLSRQITVEAKGEILELKNTINTMVDQLRGFASEVTRVAREVGTEGNLGAQAEVKGVAGTWKDLTDQVNALAGNLTNQVRNIALVTTAVANGDLSQKITVKARGEILELKNTINTMVDQLRAFASEVTRVAREVGTEGKLGAQAEVTGVSGTWKDLTDSVNFLAGNLTSQVRNIATVTTAVAKGDLSKTITVEARGEILELKNTINTMVDQLNSFAAEVTRVAREVGTEGKLGGQAQVPGVAGTWKDLTDNVNQLAGNLTNQVRNIALVTTSVANGDLSKKITVEAKGEILELKETINTMVDQLNSFAAEVTRVAREVGTEGKLGGQAQVLGVAGTWKDLTENVNQLAGNLTNQVRNIALVTKAVASGDLSQKITVEAKGEILELKTTINRMVDQLNSFAAEVTRVAREVGTEGKLAGQAQVPGVAGIWKDLTDNVNTMANNLTSQVRGIAKVVTAVANGDLSQKLLFEAKGEIASLADTINSMTDTLRIFADQVTTVAREVGIEGKLGGQAKVPGASGTWRDLTDNVNQLAGNLTTQVRAIADVATAVTTGDLTRSITVEAQGEVLELKDNINQMISNLRDTTITNKEQDWLKTNLAKFTGMMQGQRSIESLSMQIMNELTPVVSAQFGAFYVFEGGEEDEPSILKLISSYAYSKRKHVSNRFSLGEGLVGQSALEKKAILVTDVPEDYIHIVSGLGEAPPRNMAVFPVLFEGQLKAIIELASFQAFSAIHLSFLEQLMQSIGVVFNMISASMRTEELLQELQRSNAELEGRSQELEDKAKQLEVKNQEIAKASASIEEKARELSRISKYKSDFLANMSHELRTPLNSLLILAKMLADNESGTLTSQQVEFAKTIHSSGNDLLALINEILDLSKIEAGRMTVEYREVSLDEIRDYVEKSFNQVAHQKGLQFDVRIEPNTPPSIVTDSQRLSQILKNLISNAFKFTEKGSVRLDISLADRNLKFKNPVLNSAKKVLSFRVIDTGIGIPEDKQELIFEAFQQVDTTTARKYGGTGLGLTISRDLVKLLGGEMWLSSKPGEGSTFTLFLPMSGIDTTITEVVQHNLSRIHTSTDALLSSQDLNRNLSGRNILVIDDDPRGRYALEKLLQGRQVKTATAESGEEGIEYLMQHPEIEIVLMDMVMPGMDGFEAVEEIKKRENLRNIPIVAYSSKSIPNARDKALSIGCVEYIENPSEGNRILTIVSDILTSSQQVEDESANAEENYGFQNDVSGSQEKNLEGRKIMLVDDDARNLYATTSFLENRGATIVAVNNAPEAVEKLKEDPSFELVLMDIMMPEMDGYEATRQIREFEILKDIPIIAVTAKAMPEDREKAMTSGFDDFVAKPIVNEELLMIIEKHLPPKNLQ
ncbi:HAMP domain-containing protein [Pseudobdellovibrio sp. HCB154]|uniref:HAMP domain-containing protein n=1 Tax=Pseudobdellovibrio sp. HCB154 TaxID=3386277 RepID=UPI003916EDF7